MITIAWLRKYGLTILIVMGSIWIIVANLIDLQQHGFSTEDAGMVLVGVLIVGSTALRIKEVRTKLH